MESSNQIPDGDTLGRFRNLLVKNELQEKLFSQVVEQLTAKGLILKKGTIVDSTIISAPTSTKNRERKRHSDAHQTRKGNTWYFGYKAHIGVDKDSGLTHTVKATPANVHDVTMMSELLTGEEEIVYGDSGYLGAEKREEAILKNRSGKMIKYNCFLGYLHCIMREIRALVEFQHTELCVFSMHTLKERQERL